MKITSAAKVGFTVIVVAFALIVIFRGLGYKVPGFSGSNAGKYNLYVSFDSVKGLNPGADILLNGNPIGEVGDMVNYAYGGVGVELLINRDQPIHEHANFIITRESIFGSYLVSIDEPRSGYLTQRVTDESGEKVLINIATGSVEEGALVLDRNGDVFGQVESVEQSDSRSDLVVILLVSDTRATDDMAFVPKRPSAVGPGGLVISAKLEDGAHVDGTREPGPEDLVVNADLALREITDQTTAIMAQLTVLLGNVEEVLAPEDIRLLVDGIKSDITQIANNIIMLTDRMNSILAESEPYLIGTMENVEGITSDTRALVQGFAEYNDPAVRQDISDIVTNLAEASDNLVTILEDIESYTSDEQMQEDIRGSIHEARATIEQARGTLENADAALGEISSGMNIFGGIDTGAEFTLRYAPEPDRWSGDLNFRIAMEQSDVFVQGGVDDIGENDQVNAQVGWWVNDEVTTRFGVHRGKLGLGLDWQSDAYRIMNDVYDLNDLRWDIYAGYAVLPELDLIVGVEDLLDDDEVSLGFAIPF